MRWRKVTSRIRDTGSPAAVTAERWTEARALRALELTLALISSLTPPRSLLRNLGRLSSFQYIYIYTRPNYIRSWKEVWVLACGNVPFSEYLREEVAILAFGNRETPYFDEDTEPRGRKVPCFTVPFPDRFSVTP